MTSFPNKAGSALGAPDEEVRRIAETAIGRHPGVFGINTVIGASVVGPMISVNARGAVLGQPVATGQMMLAGQHRKVRTQFYGGGSTGMSFAQPSGDAVREAVSLNRRLAAATAFARLARNFPGVSEIWLEDLRPDLRLAVVLREADLEHELGLQGLFIELMDQVLDPTVGELSVFSGVDDVPDWIRDGQRL